MGTAGMVGVTVGIRASDYDTSVAFYTAVFAGVSGGAPETGTDGGVNTTFGRLLLVQPGNPPTQHADVFLEVPSMLAIQAVQDRVKAAGFNVDFQSGSNATQTWVKFPDPDGNLIWVVFNHPSPF